MYRAHMEKMMGSPAQSLVYCSKQDKNPFVKGVLPNPGKRTDLQACCEDIESGMTMRQVAKQNASTFVKYHKGLIAYRSVCLGDRQTKPTVVWLHGETGVGKTRCAVQLGRQYGQYWISNGSLRWFDGYTGEDVAIIDDFREGQCTFEFLLRLLDRYPIKVEFKGGFVDWIPTIIIITSSMSPTFMFQSKLKDDVAQLLRRIDNIYEFTDSTPETFLLDKLGIASLPQVQNTTRDDTTGPTRNQLIDLTLDDSYTEPDIEIFSTPKPKKKRTPLSDISAHKQPDDQDISSWFDYCEDYLNDI